MTTTSQNTYFGFKNRSEFNQFLRMAGTHICGSGNPDKAPINYIHKLRLTLDVICSGENNQERRKTLKYVFSRTIKYVIIFFYECMDFEWGERICIDIAEILVCFLLFPFPEDAMCKTIAVYQDAADYGEILSYYDILCELAVGHYYRLVKRKVLNKMYEIDPVRFYYKPDESLELIRDNPKTDHNRDIIRDDPYEY